jgi:hypothetical protein
VTSALVGGEWSVSRPGRFTPEGRALGTYWIGGWVSPRTGLDDVEERNVLPPSGFEIQLLGRPVRSQSHAIESKIPYCVATHRGLRVHLHRNIHASFAVSYVFLPITVAARSKA